MQQLRALDTVLIPNTYIWYPMPSAVPEDLGIQSLFLTSVTPDRHMGYIYTRASNTLTCKIKKINRKTKTTKRTNTLDEVVITDLLILQKLKIPNDKWYYLHTKAGNNDEKARKGRSKKTFRTMVLMNFLSYILKQKTKNNLWLERQAPWKTPFFFLYQEPCI